MAGRNSISFRFSGLKVKICCFQQLLSTKSDFLFRMTLRTLFDFTSDNKGALVTLSLSCKLDIVLNNNDDHISIDKLLPKSGSKLFILGEMYSTYLDALYATRVDSYRISILLLQ